MTPPFLFAQQSRAIGGLDHVGHVASGRDIHDGDVDVAIARHIQYFAHQNTSVQRYRFAGLKVDFEIIFGLDGLEEVDQFITLIIVAGDMVTTTEIEPFKLMQPRRKALFYRLKGALERA